MIEINKIKDPFIYYCQKVIPLAFDESLSYYEVLCHLTAKIKEVIEEQNIETDAIKELQEKYILLADYVDHYFDNLDIQEEIDNKLEEMYEGGQLAEIIAQFLEYSGVYGFDTKDELKACTSFVNGSIAMTLGNLAYNDGKINMYKVRNVLTTDVIDDEHILAITSDPTLIAEKIDNFYIDDLYDLHNENKNQIQYNKSHQLADFVQAFPSNIDLSTTFTSDWSITGFVITTINNVEKGIVVANDWREDAHGNYFDIKSFDYTGGAITNITSKQTGIPGHANGICKIDDTHILIIGMSYNYVYDIVNNTYTDITSDIPYCRSCAEYNGHIYVATDYDHNTNQVVNALYEISFNSSYQPSLIGQHTLPGYYDKVKMQNQGMVIYDDLIIFPAFNSSKLLIWDYNTYEYLKTQVFTAPYMVEYEDGYVYNGQLLLNDGLGKVFIPDLYCHESYGDYNYNPIAKSLTDICVYDDVIKLNGNSSPSITIDFTKYICFSHDPYSDIGTIGGEFESFTLYGAIRSYPGSNALHNIDPIEIPLYKKFSYGSETVNYEMQWQTSYMNWASGSNTFSRNTICGHFSLGGGDSVPKMTITMDPYLLTETFNTNGTQAIEVVTGASYPPQLYITKIIGHRKVGLHY